MASMSIWELCVERFSLGKAVISSIGAIIVVQFDLFSHCCGGCICGNDLVLPARTHNVPIVAAMAMLFFGCAGTTLSCSDDAFGSKHQRTRDMSCWSRLSGCSYHRERAFHHSNRVNFLSRNRPGASLSSSQR